MTTFSHDPAAEGGAKRRSVLSQLLVREMWVSLAISVMWLVVLFDALFGPDIVSQSGAGTNSSSVPSAVVVAVFAFFGSWVVARYGLGERRD